ncbi:MAG: hypothetical protein ACRDT6_11230 [Micromonosporaceae bacterium]
MSHKNNQPARVKVDHPDWCDPTLCTVATAADVPEGHNGRPATVTTTYGLPRNLTVTAHLYQQTMYPLAGPYVALEVQGLDADHQEVGGTTLIPAEDAARLGSVLLDMATAAGAAAGPPTSGTPQAVIREHEDMIDIIVWFGLVPLTFAEARDIEDQVCAILAIFDPQPGDRRDNEFLRAVLATEYPDRKPGQPAGGDQ